MPLRPIALAAALALFALPALAQDGDPEKGKSQFGQCRACHTIENGQNRVGPHLFAVVGRKAGSVEKYAYSEGLKGVAEKGIVWDEANLMDYLADPNAYLKKILGRDSVANKMPNKFPDEALRKNIIAYLKTIK